MTALERQSIMNDLGKTIAKHRKEHGLNQSQLAKELIDYNVHVKQNTVSAWESGITQPSARQLKYWIFMMYILNSLERTRSIHSET